MSTDIAQEVRTVRRKRLFKRANRATKQAPHTSTASVLAWPLSEPSWNLAQPFESPIDKKQRLEFKQHKAKVDPSAIQWHIVDFESYVNEGFDLNALIYSAIMYKVRAISSAPLRAWKGTLEQPEQLTIDDPLAQLVARPNTRQSWGELQGQAVAYLNLDGNAYFWLSKRNPDTGLPDSMWCPRPDRVFLAIERDKNNKPDLLGYWFVPDGKRMSDGTAILPEDMMHVKLPNPGDPWDGLGYGLSPISPAAYSADTDNSVTKFIKLFFERGGVPPYWFMFDQPMDDPQVVRLQERIKEMYGGYENWTKHGVLDSGGKISRVGLTFEEMGFTTLDERNESRIVMPFGVPPILLGTRFGLLRSTYSNYETARRAFWEDTMIPELRWFEDEFQYFLHTDKSFVKFDLADVPALKKNIPELVAPWALMVANGVPKDIAAATVGLPLEALPDDGIGYLPFNMAPITSRLPEEQTDQSEAPEATDDERDDEKVKKVRTGLALA